MLRHVTLNFTLTTICSLTHYVVVLNPICLLLLKSSILKALLLDARLANNMLPGCLFKRTNHAVLILQYIK